MKPGALENNLEFPSQPLKNQLVAKLRESIETRRYKPGSWLNESKLARQFGVSRVPVHEALMQLREQGLVMSHPRRGMFVNSLTQEEGQQINSLRLILETEALKLCHFRRTKKIEQELAHRLAALESWQAGSQLDAVAIDLEFHRTLWKSSGNPQLQKTLESLVPIVMVSQALENMTHESMRWRLSHHRKLFDVVVGASAQSPEEAVLEHLSIDYKYPERFSSLESGEAQTNKYRQVRE